MISRHAVGAQQREVLDIVGGFDLLSVDRVIKANLFVRATRNAEAEREGFSRCGATVAFGATKLAHAGVEQPGLIGSGFLAVAGMSRSEVAIGESFLKDGVGDLAMEAETLRLLVFLIPTEIEPAQTFKNRVDRGVRIALDIRVIEAENHGSTVVAGVEPVEDESPGAADMQKTSGRWRESNAKHNV